MPRLLVAVQGTPDQTRPQPAAGSTQPSITDRERKPIRRRPDRRIRVDSRKRCIPDRALDIERSGRSGAWSARMCSYWLTSTAGGTGLPNERPLGLGVVVDFRSSVRAGPLVGRSPH